MTNRLAPNLRNGILIAVAAPALALAAGITGGEYTAAKDRAAQEYKAARARCDSLSGNPKVVCVTEARAAEIKSRAQAEAAYKNTEVARRDARVASAEADYDVAKAKCDALTGNEKDVCLKEAKAQEVRAKADAKADLTVAEARRDAMEDKRDAEYKVALEKCDALAGPAKQACVADAKARYTR